jgi:uncharacterized protein (DUF305 family)
MSANQIDQIADETLEPPPPSGLSRPWWTLIALTAVALLVLAFLGLRAIGDDDAPSDDSAEAGFVRDMQVHHAQAVQMAGIAYRRTENEEIRTLAYDILTTQQAQIGVMMGWLAAWDLPQGGDEPAMAWMGHEGPMPGLATDEEIGRLESLPPAEMDRLFLELMIRHHEGGLAMARAAVERADVSYVEDLATGIVNSQQAEIANMQALLAARQ